MIAKFGIWPCDAFAICLFLKTEIMDEKAFSVITSRVNISCKGQVVWPTKGTGGLKHHNFFDF